MKKPLLTVKSVWKTYHMGKVALDVLKGVTVHIYPGDFVIILGPSGSGKSTLMNHLGLLDAPTKGKVLFEQQDITHLTDAQLAGLRGRQIGFVFQQFNLLPTLTALENVTLPALFQNMDEHARLDRGKEVLGLVGLADRLDHKPTELSGGQQQRVALARALMNDPQIILADEPTGNLDSTSGKQVMELLQALHQDQQKTLIIVTHDAQLVDYSSRIIRIHDGEIVEDSYKNKVM